MARTPLRPGQRKKTIEEVVSYALGHRIRVHILIVLNEGTFTPAQIARIIDEPLNQVSNHIRELVDAGSIELAKTEQVRNATLHYYRAVEMPYYSDEEYAAMTPQERQVTIGLVVQSAIAEIMAALWGGRLPDDPRLWLAWDWFNVDKQGREDIADEQEGSWGRLRDIEIEATNRRAKTGEEAQSIIVTQFGYVRARKGPVVPTRSQDGEHLSERD
ncbi:MAG TPA: winged helix-turn-helix domain-containing protein [Solirubrobacterales bacterium]|nr:winged helix-turn-helix domain-containing protein [Solirubrobacterales bacterium]